MAVKLTVPFLDLKQQFAALRAEALAAVTEVLDSQWCIGGPKVTELEERIAQLAGCSHAVAASSGTDALINSLMSLDIGPGDEVITTVFTFFATVGSIVRVGAKPVFVDIDPRTFNLDPARVKAAVTENTKAIMPVHLYGQMADMDPIMTVAREHGLAVIEDAAQAIGSSYKGKPAGSVGTTGCFSFYPTKNLGACGDAGMIVTHDADLADRMRIMRDHGQNPKYHYRYIGGNFRLDAVQAAILLVKIDHLDGWKQRRQEHAAYYNERFASAPVTPPFIQPDCESVYNLYCIRTPDRDGLMAYLREQGIGCDVYYPVPLHRHECFAHLGHAEDAFPQANQAALELLSLPIFPEMTVEMREYVADTLLGYFG